MNVQLIKGRHHGPHTGQRLHGIARRWSRGSLIGLEGQLPRRGGWFIVWFFKP